MNQLMDRLREWNRKMNGLPRVAVLVAITLFGTWLFIVVFPYCWPFILAFLLSRLLAPPVRFCMNHMKRVKLPRGLITLFGMILLFGILGTGIFALANRMIRELVQLAQNVPGVRRMAFGYRNAGHPRPVPKLFRYFARYSHDLR